MHVNEGKIGNFPCLGELQIKILVRTKLKQRQSLYDPIYPIKHRSRVFMSYLTTREVAKDTRKA